MYLNNGLGYASSRTGYHSYYQSLLPHVHKGISNAFWSIPNLSLQTKRYISCYRTGTLLNQKHTVRFKKSTSLSVHSVSKQILLSLFFQGVDTISSLE